MMANNRHTQEESLRREYEEAGGHAIIDEQELFDPWNAEQKAAPLAVDLIRWVLEHKGINILYGDCSVGHITINHWQELPGNNKIPGPNTYSGYLGWKS